MNRVITAAALAATMIAMPALAQETTLRITLQLPLASHLGQNLLTKRTFGDYSDGWIDAGWLRWTYVLDIGPDGPWWPPFLAEYYNSGFAMAPFVNGVWSGQYIDIPSTAAALDRSPSMPLNGRLSGTWIEPG